MTIKNLEKIVEEYPGYERMADTYFNLFVACSRWDEPEKAEHYRNLLILNYPDSTMTRMIQQDNIEPLSIGIYLLLENIKKEF